MLNPVEQLKLSEYAGLYDRIIPEHHILRKFNELVNFDFIYKLKLPTCQTLTMPRQ